MPTRHENPGRDRDGGRNARNGRDRDRDREDRDRGGFGGGDGKGDGLHDGGLGAHDRALAHEKAVAAGGAGAATTSTGAKLLFIYWYATLRVVGASAGAADNSLSGYHVYCFE